MFTVKLILVGLVALTPNPEGPGMTALLVDTNSVDSTMPRHEAWAVVWKGECRADDCTSDGDPFAGFSLAWRLDEHDLVISTLQDRQSWVLAGGREGEEPLPDEDNDLPDASWVPKLSWFVPGGARRLDNCVSHVTSCPISGRVWLDQGTLSSCHLAHNEDGEVYAYQVGSKSQAIANAVVVEFEVEGEPQFVSLQRRGFGRMLGDAVIVEPHGGDVVTLLILNEPVGQSSGNNFPREHKHFAAFHALLRKAGMGHPVRLEDHTDDHPPGSCEADLVTLACCLELTTCRTNPTCGQMVPHGASECDASTIP